MDARPNIPATPLAGSAGPTLEGTAPSARVLVVDDSPSQRKLLGSMLRRAGYDVLSAADASEALELLDNTKINVVVCDWMMPGLSGPDFCARVRAMEREDYIYILILTSKSEKGATAHALDAGADDFLLKPVDSHELRARVRAGARIVDMQHLLIAQNQRVSTALDEISALYNAIDRDLAEARHLQQALLPDPTCDFGAAKAGFLLRSAGKVGGDLVGHFPAGEGKLGIFSVDVSGHGVASAFLTVRLAGMFSNAAPEQNVAMAISPDGKIVPRTSDAIAAEINRRILSDVETELYLTLCLVILDLATGKAEMVQAGHPHPFLQRNGGPARRIGKGGLPVGLVFHADYDVVRFRMKPGDRLFLHSDGFSECESPTGEMLGMRRLSRFMRDQPPGQPFERMEAMVDRLVAYSGTDDFIDDVSGVLIDYVGP